MAYNFRITLLKFYSLLPEPCLFDRFEKKKLCALEKHSRKLMSMSLAFCHSSEYDNDGFIRQNNKVIVSYDEGTLLPQRI